MFRLTPLFYSTKDLALARDVAAALLTLNPSAELRMIDLETDESALSHDCRIAIFLVGPEKLEDISFDVAVRTIKEKTGISQILLVAVDKQQWPERYRAFPRISLENWTGDSQDSNVRAIAATVFDRDVIDPWDSTIDQAVQMQTVYRGPDGSLRLHPALLLRVDEMDFAVRTARALREDNIMYFGDVIQRTEAELLHLLDGGREGLAELKAVAASYGLQLGAEIPIWPPSNFEAELARSELAVRMGTLEQQPLGATFELGPERLLLNLGGSENDEDAAAQSLVRQLHPEVIRKARAFQDVARRLDNQVGWQGIGALGERLLGLVDCRTDELVHRLSGAYSALLELGSYLEMDEGVARGASSFAVPLDVETRRPLVDLVRTAAPWLRSFPTIRALDDQMGQFFAPDDLLSPSVGVLRQAESLDLVSSQDAAAVIGLLDAAVRGNVQAQKAKGRGILTARNLAIAAASAVGTIYISAVGADIMDKSVLVRRASDLLLNAEQQILQLVDNLPDLKTALRSLAEPPPASKNGS